MTCGISGQRVRTGGRVRLRAPLAVAALLHLCVLLIPTWISKQPTVETGSSNTASTHNVDRHPINLRRVASLRGKTRSVEERIEPVPRLRDVAAEPIESDVELSSQWIFGELVGPPRPPRAGLSTRTHGLPEADQLRIPPPSTYARHLKGRRSSVVVVEVLLSRAGVVEDAWVVRSDESVLEAIALEAARSSTFRPGRSGGRTTEIVVPVVFEFRQRPTVAARAYLAGRSRVDTGWEG